MNKNENRKSHNFLLSILLLFFLLFLPFETSFAENSYVLPYPSFMPGNKIYKFYSFYESLKKYWYFGDLGRFSYDLKQTDRYLVQSKVLFEYQQYLLAEKSLKISDNYFSNLNYDLNRAKKNHKDISDKYNLLKLAIRKHQEILLKLQQDLPKVFIWQPEKSASVTINIYRDLENSIKVRSKEL